MSIRKRVTWDQHGDPVLTIRVEGWHDIFRFAWHLCHGQVEFCRVGSRTLRSLRRRDRRRFDVMDDRMNNGKARRYAA